MLFKKKKDYDYFDFFISSAQNAREAAGFLNESFNDFSRDTLAERVSAMHDIENRADDEKHDAMQHLIHEFIPPIEREDISALAHQLDNVVDSIDDVMLRIDMFNVSEILPRAITFTELIIKCCDELIVLMTEFKSSRNSPRIGEAIVTINSFESEGDKLHTDCMKALYAEDISAKSLLAWTSIYDDLESCLDACENCTEIIETVIMKNS